MSVSTTISKVSYTFTGATRTFSFPFRIISEADLEVTVNDSLPLTEGTHYTVDNVNYYEGGNISFLSSYTIPVSAVILIRRIISSFTQDTIFRNQGAYYAKTVEDALDKVTMMCQELRMKVNLLPSYPDTTLNVDNSFPLPVVNTFFRWATRTVEGQTQFYLQSSALAAADITSGTFGVGRGGTGQTTQQAALNALAAGVSAGQFLRGNGTNVVMSAIQVSDVPTLNQATTGTAANVTGVVAFTNGGTGQTTQQAALNALAGAITAGQFLRGNGTNVAMSAIQVSDVPTLNQNTTGTSANVTGTVAIVNGGTGQTTQQAALNALAGAVTAGQFLRGNGANVVMSAISASDITGTLSLASGGTGATSAASAWTNIGVPAVATVAPAALSSAAAIGSSNQWARADHVHQFPTLANLGVSNATPLPVGSGGTGQTSISAIQTAFGIAAGATVAPLSLGVSSSIGTSARWAREDHVHIRPTLAELNAAARGANTDITSISLTSGSITNAPISSNDIVNKSYVDAAVSAINFHNACNVATTADLGAATYNNGTAGIGATITKTSPFAGLVIDGQTLTAGQRVLVKNQTSALQNGIYTVTNIGSGSTAWVLTRALDYDVVGTGPNEINQGDFVLIISGAANANSSWILQSAGPYTIGTTAISWVQFSAGASPYTAGTGLSLTGYQFNVSTVPLANGGTGQTTQQAALNALAAGVSAGQFLRGNGTNVVMSAILASDVPTLNQATTGTAANVTGIVAIANGGTGQTSQQSALNALAGAVTAGQFLRGNGANVVMAAISASDITGTLSLASGGTGATSAASAWTNIGVPAVATVAPVSVGSAAAAIGSSNQWARADHVHQLVQVPENRGTGVLAPRSDIYNDMAHTASGTTASKDRFTVTGIAGYPIEYNTTAFTSNGTLTLNAPDDLDVLQFQTGVPGYPNGVWRFSNVASGSGGSLDGDVTGGLQNNVISRFGGYPIVFPTPLTQDAVFRYDAKDRSFYLDTKITDLLGYNSDAPSINIGEGSLVSETNSQTNFSSVSFSVSYSGAKQTLTAKSHSSIIYLAGSNAIAQFTLTVGSATATCNNGTINFLSDENIIGLLVNNTSYFGGIYPRIVSWTSTSITFNRTATSALTTAFFSVSDPFVHSSNGNVSEVKLPTIVGGVSVGEVDFQYSPYSSSSGFRGTVANSSTRTIATSQSYLDSIDLSKFGSPATVTGAVSVNTTNNIAIGKNSGSNVVTGTRNIFIGTNANVGTSTTAIAGFSNAAIGEFTSVSGNNNNVLGSGSSAGSSSAAVANAVAIGNTASARSTDGISIGLLSVVSTSTSGGISIGSQSSSTGTGAPIALGNLAAAVEAGISIGQRANYSNLTGQTLNSIAIGSNAQAANGRVSIGTNADVLTRIDTSLSPRQTLFATGSSGTHVLTYFGLGAENIYPWMGISGTGIPANTVIEAVDTNSGVIYLSAPLTAAVTSSVVLTLTHAFAFASDYSSLGNTVVKNCTFTSGSGTIQIHNTAWQNTSNIKINALVTGTGIPAGCKVQNILSGDTIELSAPTTAAGTNVAITINSTLGPFSATSIVNSPVLKITGTLGEFNQTQGDTLIGSTITAAAGGIPVGARILKFWSQLIPTASGGVYAAYLLMSRNATTAATTSLNIQRNDYAQYLSASITAAQAYGPTLTVTSTNIRVGDIVYVNTTGRPIVINTATITKTSATGSIGNSFITFPSGLSPNYQLTDVIIGMTITGTGIPANTTVTAVIDEFGGGPRIDFSAPLTAAASGTYNFTTTNLQACSGFFNELLSWSGAEVVSTSSATEITLSKNVTFGMANVDILVVPKDGGVSLGHNALSFGNELALGDMRVNNTAGASIIAYIPATVAGREGSIPIYARS